MAINVGTNTPLVREERSVGELLGDLMHETATLIQQELSLAKAEMSQKAATAGANAGAIAVGGAVLYAGLLTLIAGIVLMLAQFGVMPAWAAALLMGVIVAAIGGFLVKRGMDTFKNMDVAPRQTIATLKEDKEWAQQQLK